MSWTRCGPPARPWPALIPAAPRGGDAREALRILLATREHATKTRTATVNTLKALILTAPAELRAQFRGRPTAGQVRAALTPVRSRQRTPRSGTTSGRLHS
jgi:hypothetical protein